MKKLFVLLIIAMLSISCVGCGSDKTKESSPNSSSNSSQPSDSSSNSSQSTENSQSSTIPIKHKPGETVTFYEKSTDKPVLKFTINSAKLTDDRNQFEKNNPEQVFYLDYTYENLGWMDNLYLSSAFLKVLDEYENVCDVYPVTGQKNPSSTPVGAKCTAKLAFGTKQKSNKVTIHFDDGMFIGNSDIDATFEVPLT